MNFCVSNIFFFWLVVWKNWYYWLSYVWNFGNNRIDLNWYIGLIRLFCGEVRKKLLNDWRKVSIFVIFVKSFIDYY